MGKKINNIKTLASAGYASAGSCVRVVACGVRPFSSNTTDASVPGLVFLVG